MSKFLSLFLKNSLVFSHKTSYLICGFSLLPDTVIAMSKRSGFHRTPKFRPEVRRRLQQSNTISTSSNMQSKQQKIEVLEEPIKSVADKKLYKVIRLENGLTALLISDPIKPATEASKDSDEDLESSSEGSSDAESGSGTEASGHSSADDQPPSRRKNDFDEEKLAACALTVGVGSFSDPPDIQGLAHFVEHMLFMGSEKYPKENEFDSFIKKKGGSDNAATDCEVTSFYFQIQEKHLPQAMDMFSQFFVSPLMKKDAMQREREAIESEFAIAQPSDSNRKDQLLASLFPQSHPARTFTWGDLRSLRDELQDDERLHRAAHSFVQRHYSAHRCTVAVQARVDLPILEHYVVTTFGNMKRNDLPPQDFSEFRFRPDAITPEFRSFYYVKPLSDTTEVHLTWAMRPLMAEYESKPHQYIAYLLGHEGRGSLLSYLKKKVWALGIYTGNSESGIDYTSMYSLFSAQIVLTKNGLDHIDEVLEALFSYINMLRIQGPSKRIYEEIKTIEETNFRFEEESSPDDYVEKLAENMHLYPPKHYITGDRLYFKYDPQAIKELLESMTADKANVMVLSNKHTKPIQYDSKEKWFGTEYKKEEIPQNWLNRWLNAKPYDAFHLPIENIYVTTNFDLIPPASPYLEEEARLGINLNSTTMKEINKKMKALNQGPVSKVLQKNDLIATVQNFRLDQPNLLRKNRQLELWYKPDFKFRFPTALLYFYFITPLSLKSARDSCLFDLWNDVLQQNLKEEVYPANLAGLSHAIYVADRGVALKVNGYSQNLHLLVDLITHEMCNSSNALSPSLFEAVRDVRARNYHNVLIKPNKLAKDVRMNVLLDPYISPRDKATVIQNVTLQELQAFHKRLLSTMNLQVLMQGNIPWEEAIRISEKVLTTMKFDPLEESNVPQIKVHKLPLGEQRLRIMSLNKASTNSFVTNYYQAGLTNRKETAILEVLMMLMEEPVFDNLRTKEQLGYSVFSMMRYTFGVLGFSVTVNTQVDKFSVSYVDSRVESFLKKFARDMKKLSDKTLQATKSSLVQLKYTTDYELKEEVERNWREIMSREYQFQRLIEEAAAIESLHLSEFKGWVDSHFPTGNRSNYRKLSVQIMGHKVDKDENKTIAEEQTEQLKEYNLQYLDETHPIGDTTETEGSFIKNINQFKKELPLFEVPSVELGQC